MRLSSLSGNVRSSLFANRSSPIAAEDPQWKAKGEKRGAKSDPCYNLPVMIPPDLLEILVCPVCRKPVTLRGEDALKCNECHRVYPIRNGIPIMLEHEATIETRS